MTSIIRCSHLFALLFLALFLSVAEGRLSLGTIGKLGTKAVSAAKELNGYLVNAGDGACWQESYGRGAGEPLSSCRPGEQKNGALCYPACPSNLPNGVGPVCWSTCASGYYDDGAVCRRNAQIISADNGNCPWYDKCGLTFSRGCSSCPAGYQNDGCTCRIDANIYAKQSRGRGAGNPLICRPGLEQDGGLCYQPCMQGFKAVGPVCWAHCAGQYSSDCGAMCTTTSAACASRMVDLSLSILSDITAAVTGNLFSAATGLVDIAKDLALPICGRKYTDVELAAFKAARQLRRKRR